MIRTTTGRLIARVHNHYSGRDGTKTKLVSQSMCPNQFSSFQHKLSTSGGPRSLPLPTSFPTLHFGPEAVCHDLNFRNIRQGVQPPPSLSRKNSPNHRLTNFVFGRELPLR